MSFERLRLSLAVALVVAPVLVLALQLVMRLTHLYYSKLSEVVLTMLIQFQLFWLQDQI